MSELFNPISLLLHILNAFILLAALYYFLYKPVRKFMTKRADKITQELNEAQSAQDRATATLDQSKEELKSAERKASETIAQSAQQAQQRAEQIIAAAQRDADVIRDRARREADAMIKATHASLVDESASLAVEIAEKLLAREVKLDDHRRLIDEFRAKVG